MKRLDASEKWIYLVMLLFAGVVAFLAGSLIEFGIYKLNLHRKIRHIFLYGELVAVGVGVLVFVLMIKHRRWFEYIQEVINETIKVSWPAKREVVATTIVVIIGVLIAGGVLGVFDHFFSIFMRWLLTQ